MSIPKGNISRCTSTCTKDKTKLLLLVRHLKAADFLTKLGHGQSDLFVDYVTPPFDIMEVLSDDVNAVYQKNKKVDLTVHPLALLHI